MPREIARAPRHPSRTIMDRTVQESVARVQTLPGMGGYSPTGAPPLQATQEIVDVDGNVYTAHPAVYDVDSYDDVTALYYREGYDAFTI